MTRLYAASWLDDYDGDYGVYCCFRDREKCLDYLADMVVDRAANLKVRVVDIEGRARDGNGVYAYPDIERDAVRKILDALGDFSLVLKTDECGEIVDKVTVGIREVDVK